MVTNQGESRQGLVRSGVFPYETREKPVGPLRIGSVLHHASDQSGFAGGRAALVRLAGALLRAFAVLVAVVTPSVLWPDAGPGARQISALLALMAGVLVFFEYTVRAPGLIAFRDAPPFNRLRFLMLFCMVLALTLIARGDGFPGTDLARALGGLVDHPIDRAFGPLHPLPPGMGGGAGRVSGSRLWLPEAAGMAWLIALTGMGLFALLLRLSGWPGRGQAFNVWVNLPSFDPTTGADVIVRLNRHARVNIVLALLLPFLIPATCRLVLGGFGPAPMLSPQILIWMVTAWAFLPASLLMRGLAIRRIAGLILTMRRERETVSGRSAATA